MKILWLGHNLAYPPKGGALQRNYNLLRQAASGAEVHFLGFDQPLTRPAEVTPQDCIQKLRDFCVSADWVPLSQQGLTRNRYSLALRAILSGDPYEVHWLRETKMKAKFLALLKRVTFDVVHFDTLGLAQYMPLIGSSRAVLNHHDVQSALMTRRWNSESNPVMKWFWGIEAQKLRQAETRWGDIARVNLVCSEDEAKLLSGVTSCAQTTVVANGVDIEYFSMRPDPSGEILLFCGSLDMYPNQEAMKYFFKSVWPQVAVGRKNVEMYVVGRKPPEWLQRQASADSRVRVTGFVDDVRPYFQRATVCICPIREGGGTRLKILDSLAMGVPVIGTTFACSGLNLKHEHDVLMADTPEDFAFQTKRLLDSRTLRVRLASAGREVVEREYSWDVVGRSLLGAYEQASLKELHLEQRTCAE